MAGFGHERSLDSVPPMSALGWQTGHSCSAQPRAGYDPKPPFPLSEVTVLRALLLNRDAQNLAFSLRSAQARPWETDIRGEAGSVARAGQLPYRAE